MVSQFFEILIFNQDIWGSYVHYVHYVREINLIS